MLNSWVSRWFSKCVMGFDRCCWVFGGVCDLIWVVGVLIFRVCGPLWVAVMVVLDGYFVLGLVGCNLEGL